MFIKDLLFFIFFQLLVVYPLGKIVLDFLGMKLWWTQNLVFGISIGIVILTLSVLTLGYTNHYNLLPLFIFIPPILLFFQLKKIQFRQIRIRKLLSKSDLVVIFAIILCVLVQSIIVFPNGVKADGSLRVKGVFTEDAMWHIAIINNIKKSIPPDNPVFAGEKLVNYNYFSDIYITVIHKFTNIEIIVLYFKLVGPFLALICALSLYFVLKEFTRNKLISSLGVLLVTLSSTYYYVFGIFKPNLNPSSFFGNDYVSRMVNYQLSFSYIIITTFLFLLLSYKKINSFKFSLVAAFLIGSGIGFKSYGTILMIGALFIIGIYKSFRKDFSYIKITALTGVFTAVIIFLFLRSNQVTESVFAFNPFWIIENIFNDPLRLNSPAWEAQRNSYINNNNYLGILYIYLKGIAIFLFAGLGLKLLGFFAVIKNRERYKKEVPALLFVIAAGGIIFPLLFTQGGVKWNTVQFIWYSGFSLSILLIILITNLFQKLNLKFILIIIFLVWVSYLPGVYYYSKFYLSDTGNLTTYNFKGTQESYQAARFLSLQPTGVLLMDQKYLQTPFIVAISGKNAYFADTSILSNSLIDWSDRDAQVKLFFDSRSKENYRKDFLKRNKILYIFTSKNALEAEDYFNNIYNNNEVSIYKSKLN